MGVGAERVVSHQPRTDMSRHGGVRNERTNLGVGQHAGLQGVLARAGNGAEIPGCDERHWACGVVMGQDDGTIWGAGQAGPGAESAAARGAWGREGPEEGHVHRCLEGDKQVQQWARTGHEVSTAAGGAGDAGDAGDAHGRQRGREGRGGRQAGGGGTGQTGLLWAGDGGGGGGYMALRVGGSQQTSGGARMHACLHACMQAGQPAGLLLSGAWFRRAARL